jgi:spore maturation protein CgeB
VKFGTTPLDFVIIGRSILSSIENPTAELYRGLINELAQRGHRTTFLELHEPGKKYVRDMLKSPYCEVWTYSTTDQLLEEYTYAIQSADVILMGSMVQETNRIAEWIAEEARGVTVYYDTNLSATIDHLQCRQDHAAFCLSADNLRHFNLFLSTTGGPFLENLATTYDIAQARPLYESVDPYSFYRTDSEKSYDLGFIGNFKKDRKELLDSMLLGPAHRTPNRKFSLTGSGYLESNWPKNLTYLEYLPETNLVDFYNRQHCSLVLSRADRRRMGYTPTRRLLAAAACGVPVLTDRWDGIDDFFEPHREVFCVNDEQDVLAVLYGQEEGHRRKIGGEARKRILEQHTTSHRAEQLLAYLAEITD